MTDILTIANLMTGVFQFGTFVVMAILAVEIRHMKKWIDKHDDYHFRKKAPRRKTKC